MVTGSKLETQVRALVERNIIVRKLDPDFNPANEHLVEHEEWVKLVKVVGLLEEKYRSSLS